MPSPIPLAVVGAGRVARAVHLPCLAGLTGLFRVVAVIDADGGRAADAAEANGIGVSGTDPDLVLATGARAVLCATPWHTHAETVEHALRHGLHVLCEKPVSLVPDELTRLATAEARSGGTVTAGYMKRHDRAVAAFLRHAREHAGRMRQITVRIIDPNAPHQVAHLLPPTFRPPGGTRTAEADDIVRRVLGPDASAERRTAYAHPLGGSLIHQINLVGAVLAGGLAGTLRHAGHWAGGTSVACVWQPGPDLAVLMSYVRAPRSRDYHETIECVAESARLVLTLPSPYTRDVPSTLVIEPWGDETLIPEARTLHTVPGETGFDRQLRAWAHAIATDQTGELPGLDEAARDLRVVREVADRLP